MMVEISVSTVVRPVSLFGFGELPFSFEAFRQAEQVVRAIRQRVVPATFGSAPPAVQTRRNRGPVLSLDDYLAQRSRTDR